VVPAVLCIVHGIDALRSPWLRRGLLAAACAVAALQYAAVTLGWRATPYFLDHSLGWRQIESAMRESGTKVRHRRTPVADRAIHWRYDQDVLLVDFPADEALALTWQLFPGVSFDDATLRKAPDPAIRAGGDDFEDLFLLAAFDTYNRRAGWPHYREPLPREEVLANADFVLWRSDGGGDAAARFPGYEPVAAVARERDVVHVLRARAPTRPFRALYADAWLERHPEAGPAERGVVLVELLRTAALAGEDARVAALVARYPELASSRPARNIYWIAGYDAVERAARAGVQRAAPEAAP
jgi:hypothetical protein